MCFKLIFSGNCIFLLYMMDLGKLYEYVLYNYVLLEVLKWRYVWINKKKIKLKKS